MTIHSLSCKQILKKIKTLCFQLQQQSCKFYLYFQIGFPIKNVKTKILRDRLHVTSFETSWS